jgi:hypothetical protein
MHAPAQRARLVQEVQWCEQFAAMNRIGLQRLLEQYDRCCPAGGGARFLQVCGLASVSLPCLPVGYAAAAKVVPDSPSYSSEGGKTPAAQCPMNAQMAASMCSAEV